MPKVTHSESAFEGREGSSQSGKFGHLATGEQGKAGGNTWGPRPRAQGGYPGENSVSGKTGITSESRLKKGSSAVPRPGGAESPTPRRPGPEGRGLAIL